MGWTPGKPIGAGNPAADVTDLQGNWAYIEAFANKDHRFEGDSDDGYHNQVNLPVQSPAPAMDLDGVVYVNDNGTSKELLYLNAVHTSALSGVVARFSWDQIGLLTYNKFNIATVTVTNAVGASTSANAAITFTNNVGPNYTVIANVRQSGGITTAWTNKASKLTGGFTLSLTQATGGGSIMALDVVVYQN